MLKRKRNDIKERKGGGHDKCGIGGRWDSGKKNRKKQGQRRWMEGRGEGREVEA